MQIVTRISTWTGPTATTILCIGLVEAVARANTSLLPERFVPPPTRIASALCGATQTWFFWSAVGQTLAVWGAGLVIAAVIAMPLGIIVGSSLWTYRGSRALIELLRPIPGVALLPVLVLAVGLGFKLVLYLVIIGSVWPLLVQSLYGVQDVDSVAHDMAVAYRLGPLRRFCRLTLPSATPYIATGLRISAVLALNVAVGVELIVGAQGLGEAITSAQLDNQVPTMYAYIAATGILGVLINLSFRQLEKSFLKWHPSQRNQVPQ